MEFGYIEIQGDAQRVIEKFEYWTPFEQIKCKIN